MAHLTQAEFKFWIQYFNQGLQHATFNTQLLESGVTPVGYAEKFADSALRALKARVLSVPNME